MTKPLFTTKHYKALVRLIRIPNASDYKRGYNGYFIKLGELRELLEKDNSKFSWRKFYVLWLEKKLK